MKIAILIPVHNEAKQIGRLVTALRAKGFDVFVVDDGSTDHSGAIAQSAGAVILPHAQKLGKGLSLREGFATIVQQGYDGVVTMDGDGQHSIEDVDKFLKEAKSGQGGIINGNRMENHRQMPWVRYFTNQFMSALISRCCGQRIPDTQCGFRYIDSWVLKKIQLSSTDFEIETEILMKAAKNGIKISSIPIQTIYQDEVSKIRPFQDTLRFIKYLWRERCR